MGETVLCARCATELDFPGQGHTCRSPEPPSDEPPADWVRSTWVVVGFAVAFTVCAVALAAAALTLGPADGSSVPPGDAGVLLALSGAWLVTFVGAMIALTVWNRRTRRLAEAYSTGESLIIRHVFSRVYLAAILVTLLGQSVAGLTQRATVLTVAWLRVIAGIVLVVGVLVGRARMVRAIADSARQSRDARGTAPTANG